MHRNVWSRFTTMQKIQAPSFKNGQFIDIFVCTFVTEERDKT